MAKFPDMNWQAKDLSEEFKLFKQRVMLCHQDSNITQRDKQAIKIKIAVGTEGLRRLNASGLSEQDQSDSDKLWSIFEDQLKINVNFRIHRLELMRFRRKQTETLDEFTNRCRDKASHCLFSLEELNERVVALVIASTPLDSFRHSLLEKPSGYKITEMLEEGRRHEAVAASTHCLQMLASEAHKSDANAPAAVQQAVDVISSARRTCGNCGLYHKLRKCPAYFDTCKVCCNKGHWAKFCRKTRA